LGREPPRLLARLAVGEPAAQATLSDYRGAIEALLHRRAELERLIESLIPSSRLERELARLRCLRGIDTLSAVGLCRPPVSLSLWTEAVA
jgi:hypothetical protein